MKKYSAWKTILEIITLIGYITIAMMILTYLLRGVNFDRVILGATVAAIGAIDVLNFLTLKHIVKSKNFLLLTVGILELAFGFTLAFLNIDLFLTCVILGWFIIGFSVIKIMRHYHQYTCESYSQALLICIFHFSAYKHHDYTVFQLA